MPVSHSSSASLSSSFSFSHLSQYTSSTSSSSSPDHSVFSSSQVPPPLSTVPFLWEEKPGVVKKEMETIMIEADALLQETSETSSDAGGFFLGSTSQDDHAGLLSNTVVHHRSCSSHKMEKMRKDPSKKLSRTFLPPAIFITDGRSKALAEAKSLPRLPPPPCLIVPRPLEHACFQGNCDTRLHYRPGRYGHGSAYNSVVPTAGSTFSLHKRRHQRHASLEDDPFWVAMVSCTKEATTSDHDVGCQSRKDSRERSLSRSNSWLLKKAGGQGEKNIGVHFDQCLPRRALLKTFTRPEKGASKDDTYVSSYKVSMATNIAGTSHLTAQAFKALSLAKASLHDRCKIMLNQSGATELLDISSTSRGSSFNKKKKKKKKKLPIMDLFGCKSDLPLCGRPIIPAPP